MVERVNFREVCRLEEQIDPRKIKAKFGSLFNEAQKSQLFEIIEKKQGNYEITYISLFGTVIAVKGVDFGNKDIVYTLYGGRHEVKLNLLESENGKLKTVSIELSPEWVQKLRTNENIVECINDLFSL